MPRCTLLLWVILLVLPLSATAQPERVVEAYALPPDTPIALDGHLDEAFWQQTDTAGAFTQQEPVEGGTPSERTVVHVAYDAANLYIGARFFDSNPGGILAYQLQRDASLATDDRFMWILDTHASGRSAYFFEINPAGLMGDGLLTIGQGYNLNKDWDGIWTARVARDADGWSAEIRIPFSTLNFDTDRSVWGINFQRTVRRKSEEMLWTGYRRSEGLFRPQNAGRLVGLEGASQGLGLEITPYGLTQLDRTWTEDASTTDPVYDIGADLSYSFTPSLRAALTLNTDFAETEVDDRRVNLSRFPIRFPEKRDFFLEGSSVYRFAPSSNVEPYFSRRIGLVEGSRVPLRAGGRLNGRIGRFNVGLQQIRTGATDVVPAEDFTVARAKANVLSESAVGAVYTRRATHGDSPLPVRHTVGVDAELGTSRFRGDENLQFQAFFVAHSPSAPADSTAFFDRTTRGLRLTYPNHPWFGHVSYREFGSAFDPAVGFAERTGFRRLQPSVGYSLLLERNPVVRELQFDLRYEHLTNLDFEPETVNTELTFLNARFESGEAFEAAVGHTFERLYRAFDIRRDGTTLIPAGRYRMWNGEVEARTAPFRRIAGAVEVERRGFWTGTRTDYEAELTLRPWPGVRLTGLWERSNVDLAEGAFHTDLVRAEGALDLTPWTSFTTNVQYDNLSEVVGLYARFRWILQPGSDLYLVYTHNWQHDPTAARLRPLTREAAMKLTYSYRF